MNTETIILVTLAIVPTFIVGVIAYFFFKEHVKNEDHRRDHIISKDLQSEALPTRLQAYERMVLFLERISPNKLLIRVPPISNDKEHYENLLIQNIEQEYEHNLSQQIYISDDCWNTINTTKNAVIQLIRKASMSEKTNSADKLREVVLTEMMEKTSPTNVAISFVRNEVSKIWN